MIAPCDRILTSPLGPDVIIIYFTSWVGNSPAQGTNYAFGWVETPDHVGFKWKKCWSNSWKGGFLCGARLALDYGCFICIHREKWWEKSLLNGVCIANRKNGIWLNATFIAVPAVVFLQLMACDLQISMMLIFSGLSGNSTNSTWFWR